METSNNVFLPISFYVVMMMLLDSPLLQFRIARTVLWDIVHFVSASTLVDNCQDPKSFLDAYDRGTGRYEAGGRGDMREDLGGPNSSGPRGSLGGNPRGRWGPADRRGADDYPSKRRRY